MAYMRRLPSANVLAELVEKGRSSQEIAELYGVTREAVRQALVRAEIRPSRLRVSHADFLPWRLRADHHHDILAKRLRSYSKLRQGFPLTDDESRLVEQWLAYMDGGNRWGVPLSVHYERHEGFWLEPRQDGDRDYIHPPAA